MKANFIVLMFVVFLSLYAIRVAGLSPTTEVDNVNSQQLALHKSTLAKQQQDTITKYNTDNTISEASEASFSGDKPTAYKIEVEISGNTFEQVDLQVEPGTTIYWINEDILPHTLTLTDATGVVDPLFGTNTLRSGDQIYYRFDKPGKWEIFDPQSPKTLYGYITVVD